MACVKFHDLTVIIAIVELWATAVNGYYANETVNFARAIHNDFEYFQKTGQRISGRDGRKLISFDTRNNNIEVGFEFSVPFLTIPVKKSIETMKSSTSALVNINTGAVGLTATVVAAGIATALIWKVITKDHRSFPYKTSQYHYGRSGSEPIENEDRLTMFAETIERVLQKYNIDATTCTQRTICSSVREAVKNVADGVGTSAEKILDGVTSASWIKKFAAGTAINDAISIGRYSTSQCEQKYSGCKLKFQSFEHVLETIISTLS